MGVPVAGAPDVLPEGLESVHSLPDGGLFLYVRREYRLCFVNRHEYEGLSAPILWWDGTKCHYLGNYCTTIYLSFG